MKKRNIKAIAAALTAVLTAMVLCSCEPNSDIDISVTSTEQETPTAVAESPTAAERSRLIYADFEREGRMPEITFTDDLDNDGQEETITLTTEKGGYDDEFHVNISVSAQDITSSAYASDGYVVLAVYLLDLDTSDSSKEIAVFTMCESDDPVLEIFRYNGGLNHMTFERTDYDGSSYLNERMGTGYVSSYPFVINDDGTFTLQTQTSSRGMWDVYTYYKVDGRGIIVEVPQDVYEVVDIAEEFMTDDSGYAAVNKTITGRGLDLYAGDRITILKDDGNHNIFIQKSTGESGWFAMYGWNDEELYEVSNLFMLAG